MYVCLVVPNSGGVIVAMSCVPKFATSTDESSGYTKLWCDESFVIGTEQLSWQTNVLFCMKIHVSFLQGFRGVPPCTVYSFRARSSNGPIYLSLFSWPHPHSSKLRPCLLGVMKRERNWPACGLRLASARPSLPPCPLD